MMAMIKLWKSPVLKELNWKLLLQIHDEVILEGPKESMEQVGILNCGDSVLLCVVVCVNSRRVAVLFCGGCVEGTVWFLFLLLHIVPR